MIEGSKSFSVEDESDEGLEDGLSKLGMDMVHHCTQKDGGEGHVAKHCGRHVSVGSGEGSFWLDEDLGCPKGEDGPRHYISSTTIQSTGAQRPFKTSDPR